MKIPVLSIRRGRESGKDLSAGTEGITNEHMEYGRKLLIKEITEMLNMRMKRRKGPKIRGKSGYKGNAKERRPP